MQLADALRMFRSDDEAEASRGFDELYRASRDMLGRYVRRNLGYNQDDKCEDIVQETFRKVWTARAAFRNKGVSAWYAMLKQTARNTIIDGYRSEGSRQTISIDDEHFPEACVESDFDESDAVLRDLAAADESGRLFHAANTLWLGLDRKTTQEESELRLLAVQLFYLDALSYEQALPILNAGSPNGAPLTRETLDSWLEHPGILRCMAFHELYFSNDQLAGYLLGLGRLCESDELDSIARAASRPDPNRAGPNGWSWDQVRLVLWRFRYALYVEQILAREDCRYSPEEIRGDLATIGQRFPFDSQMAQLLRRMERFPRAKDCARLDKPNLWQRLAFQYRYYDDLPLRDIESRIQPACRQADFVVTSDKLNWWLSGGHLIDRLRKYIEG